MLNSTAWYHISSYDSTKNGRKAFESLRQFYQNKDFKQYLQDEAFRLLGRTFYRGETRQFDFDKYVRIHLKAHSMIVEADYNNGSGMDESTKVQHFKTGIKPKANLEVALTTMRSGTVNVNAFSAVRSFLAGEIKAREARSEDIDNSRFGKYNVSQIKTGGKNKFQSQ